MKLNINSEFQTLCRKLTEDEFKQLENNIKADGCIDPIKTWNDTIVDGHNRYEICRKHNIHFNVTKLNFADDDEAKLWIISNQLGRRNLSDLDRVALLESIRPILKRQNENRMKAGKAVDPGVNLPQGLLAGDIKMVNISDIKSSLPPGVHLNYKHDHVFPIKTREQLAAAANVSGKTYEALRTVNQDGCDELKEAVRSKKISASKGAKIADLPKGEQKSEVEKLKNKKKKKKEKIADGVTINKPRERAIQHAVNAINELKKIPAEEPSRKDAFCMVKDWIIQALKS